MLTQEQFFQAFDEGCVNRVFSLLAAQPSDNEVFDDGLVDGYSDYYCGAGPAPAVLSSQSLSLFLGKVLDMRVPNLDNPDFLKNWKLGYVVGWSLALGESNPDLIFHEDLPHVKRSDSYGYGPLLPDKEFAGIEILMRKVMLSHAKQPCVQYAVADSAGIYALTATDEGVSCSCGVADCLHSQMIAKLEPTFFTGVKAGRQEVRH